MSIHATAWVRRNDVRPPTDKFILYVMADYCNSHGLAYPSVTRLTLDTGYDRKTVLAALERLRRKKLIHDSGKRVGLTKSIVVYKLAWADEESALEQSSPKIGTASKTGEAVPKKGEAVPICPREPLDEPSVPPKAPQRGAAGKNGEHPKKTEWADRIADIFRRRRTTPWSEKEIKSFKKLLPLDDDELVMVERYYKAKWPPEREKNNLRHDIFTFLNNYRGEVDRAYAYCQRHPIKSKTVRFTRPPDAPEISEEEAKRRRDFVHGEVEKLRTQFRMPEADSGT